MAKKKENDSYKDYKSVLKEYDFYNNNDDDFEIIEECPNSYINNIDNNENKNEAINQNSKFESFILNIFKIIFYSRNQGSEFEFCSNSSEKKSNNSFQIKFEELIQYENLRASNSNSEKKKYFIDFYLTKNESEKDNNSMKSAKLNNNKDKLLVERWKIKYKEKFNVNGIKEFTLYLNKKLKLIEKSIIEYSRILPLYKISENEKYALEFKFCDKNKKKFINKESTSKIKLINDNMLYFKFSIKFLKIKPENIEIFLTKNISDFVIIENIKPRRRRFLSDTFQKKSSSQLLNNLEKNNEEKNLENDNNNFIKENYIDNRRLSYDNNYYSKNYINSGFKENNNKNKFETNKSGSIGSNEENFSLVIHESDDDIIKTMNNINVDNKNITKSGKTNETNIAVSTKENTPKKSQTYKQITSLKQIKSGELSKLANKNSAIKSILIDYKNVRRMVRIMPNYDDINHGKLLTFINNN